MDKPLQKKLVGAAVIIALVVIFLPMFLDGQRESEPVSVQIEIPDKPVYEVPNRLPQPDNHDLQVTNPPTMQPRPGKYPNSGSAQPTDTISVAEPEIPPGQPMAQYPVENNVPTDHAAQNSMEQGLAQFDDAPVIEPVVKPIGSKSVGLAPEKPVVSKPDLSMTAPAIKVKPSPVKTKPQKEKSQPEKAQPEMKVATKDKKLNKLKANVSGKKKKTANTGDKGYVVQVGSFSQLKNASQLKDDLVANDFSAFVETVTIQEKSIYRVKVGPNPDRQEADKLRLRLVDQKNLEGIIVIHP